MLWNLLLALLPSATASPLLDERQFLGPIVSIRNGTLIGTSSGVIDTFNGIPFAVPPVGPLRLKQPRPIDTAYGTFFATSPPKACPQFRQQTNNGNILDNATATLVNSALGQAILNDGEDCLTLNVQRPAGTQAGSNLPVLLYFFGGGFEFGSTSSADATAILKKSIELGQPILYVTPNYRLGGFGFLGGCDLKKEGNTNLGFHDQRLALQWVQENIAAFGGDPSRVTIWGESSGSISAFAHTIINGGDNTYKGKPLFRGAIMNSGSVVPATDVASPRPQAVYDQIVSLTGCSAAPDKLACLRAVDYSTFLNAANSFPGLASYRSVDEVYLPRPDDASNFYNEPQKAALNNAFARVPIIIGDQEDEGSIFALTQSNITTTAQLIDYLDSYFDLPGAPAAVRALVAAYPDDPSAGSPFRTGLLNQVYPQFKRLAAILGDITFTITRRVYLSKVSCVVPAWSYLGTFFYGTPVIGTFHGTDILALFGDAAPPVTVVSMMIYYISFVNHLDPNAISTTYPLIPWPQWSNATNNPQLMNFAATGNSLLSDTFRSAAFDVLQASSSVLQV